MTSSLFEFEEKTGLHDRGVLSVRKTERSHLLLLDLFHCDDQLRNDERFTYPAIIDVKNEDVSASEGFDTIHPMAQGEILAATAFGKDFEIVMDLKETETARSSVVRLIVTKGRATIIEPGSYLS